MSAEAKLLIEVGAILFFMGFTFGFIIAVAIFSD